MRSVNSTGSGKKAKVGGPVRGEVLGRGIEPGRLKMQDRKMTDKSAGLENAGLENDGQKCTVRI